MARVRILLTNDDGIYDPGLAAMERELRQLGEVYVVAPATEQSGVGHSITYLMPLIVKEVFFGDQHWGWAVEGSPADCVKIGVAELCPQRPELVVSGINGGQNAGINVLYSGTVAAAIEGAFFGITSVAVSLQFAEHARFDKAARLARTIIEQIRQFQCQNILRSVSRIKQQQSRQTVDQQPGAYKQHQRQRHLGCDEQAA